MPGISSNPADVAELAEMITFLANWLSSRHEQALTQGIAAYVGNLRCLHASHRWDQIWQRLHSQTAPADLLSLAS